MDKIKCAKCGKETEIDISKAIDADGEVLKCNHCGYPFRYAK
jgi:DNA-directed RNA polymerase subunit RPC12/RpoP